MQDATFARQWHFEHVTSSPRYPQSNGKAENAVKTVKRLFSKCRESGRSEFQALLDWRNTPSEGMSTSPAQRFLGRRCPTLLPLTAILLKPRYSTSLDAQDINIQKLKQKQFYDQRAKPLKPLQDGSTVRVKLPGHSTWTPAVCSGLVGPRKYRVDTEQGTYTRNRKHLLDSPESNDHQLPDMPTPTSEVEPQDVSTESPPNVPDQSSSHPVVNSEPAPVRRSQRVRKQPDWYMKYGT